MVATIRSYWDMQSSKNLTNVYSLSTIIHHPPPTTHYPLFTGVRYEDG